MTIDRLEEIKERLAAATPGPWGWSGCANDRVDVCSKAPGWEGAEVAVVTVDYEFNNRDGLVDGMPVMDRAMAHDNAALIMAAPKDLQDLVAEVERLRDNVAVNDERLATLYDEKQREVERLREAARQVHALASVLVVDWDPRRVNQAVHEIHKITKGMVE